ncbi:MAG: DNA repair exonuclease [Chloroflexi bacterium]|nr:DNA repair exonuclease [Chloroflexota bacterium]MBU1750422.1 DNA repair exonuclease [Chloroflexota bacterium]
MPVEFLHLADVHLGYQQYGHSERWADFGRAFQAALDYAVQHQMGLVLISGDLLHQSAIEPRTLLQALTGLDHLRQHDIPAVAIAGNHDLARTRNGGRDAGRDRASWLDFLAARGYLYLLRPQFTDAGLNLLPWDGQTGAYVDLAGLRVYGLPYLGAATRRVLEQLPPALAAQDQDDARFTVLLGHFGLEGELPGLPGGLPYSVMAALREHVDYLALGHWHKPFQRDDWIYNPGSLETCAMNERRWPGGFYHVTVDCQQEPRHVARHVPGRRRPLHRLVFPVDDYPSPQRLYAGLQAYLMTAHSALWTGGELAPVVEVSLEGSLAFDRCALDLDRVSQVIDEVVAPLLARPRNNTLAPTLELAPGEHWPRTELEHHVLADLVRRDGRHRDQVEAWVRLTSAVKQMALVGSPPEAIAAALRQRLTELDEEGPCA